MAIELEIDIAHQNVLKYVVYIENVGGLLQSNLGNSLAFGKMHVGDDLISRVI